MPDIQEIRTVDVTFPQRDANGVVVRDAADKAVYVTQQWEVTVSVDVEKLLKRIASQAVLSRTGTSKFVDGAVVVRRGRRIS